MSFVIVSAVVYSLIVVPEQKVLALHAPTAAAPAVIACPECLREIPAAARRCRFCTATLAPA